MGRFQVNPQHKKRCDEASSHPLYPLFQKWSRLHVNDNNQLPFPDNFYVWVLKKSGE